MFPPNHTPEHYGKTMITINSQTQTVEMIMDCATCGRFTLNVPIVHLRSTSEMLTEVANQLELPTEHTVTEVLRAEPFETDSPDDVAAVRREFDKMPYKDPDGSGFSSLKALREISPTLTTGNWD
jgi:hypothetical protein